jgi:hypothetical protein
MTSMVEMTAPWEGTQYDDDSSLLCSKMNIAIRNLAQVESVRVDRVAGVVFANVHYPDDLPDSERDRRCVRVQSALSVVVAGSFAAAGIVLAPLDGG